jgi:hypothetical protein
MHVCIDEWIYKTFESNKHKPSIDHMCNNKYAGESIWWTWISIINQRSLI